MKKISVLAAIVVVVLFGTAVLAAETCELCGMKLAKYWKTVHKLTLVDGSQKSVCSIACASRMMQKKGDGQVAGIAVVDYRTDKLVNARTATYVEGSDLKPVMSMVSRVAFHAAADARQFSTKHGGVMMGFQKALERQREEDAMGHGRKKHKMH